MATDEANLSVWVSLSKRKSVRSKLYRTKRASLEKRRRSKKKFKSMVILLTFLLCHCTVERTIWQKKRTSAWFDLACSTYSDNEWYKNFRISRNTFQFLVDELRTDIVRQDTVMRKAIEVKKKVALFLYFLASTDSYRSLANLFGVSRAFICVCIREVADAILRKLKPKYLTIAKGDELLRIIGRYKEKWGFPMCAGAIDGTHIPIATPLKNHATYVNRKSYHSIVMQAFIDDHYLFRDIVVGWPGSVHDARVFSNSELYTLGCSGQLFPQDLKVAILGREIHPVILGDPAYPLLSWLMKGYPENINTPRIQRRFNYRMSRARMTVENTFGHWKGRFRRFLKRVDMDVEGVVKVVAASCVIHNICEMRNETFFDDWLQEGFQDHDVRIVDGPRVEDEAASDVRDTLAAYFMTPEGQSTGAV